MMTKFVGRFPTGFARTDRGSASHAAPSPRVFASPTTKLRRSAAPLKRQIRVERSIARAGFAFDQLRDELAAHLEERRVGDFVDERDALGDLEASEMLPTVFENTGLVERTRTHDRDADTLAQLGAWYARGGNIGNVRMATQDGFDLDRPELLASPIDVVRQATHREEVTVVIVRMASAIGLSDFNP